MDLIHELTRLWKTIYIFNSFKYSSKGNKFIYRLISRKAKGHASFLLNPETLLPVCAYLTVSGDWSLLLINPDYTQAQYDSLFYIFKFFDIKQIFDPIAFIIFLPFMLFINIFSRYISLVFRKSSRSMIRLSILYSFSLIFMNTLLVIVFIPISYSVFYFIFDFLGIADWPLVFGVIFFIVIPYIYIIVFPQSPFVAILEYEYPHLIPQGDSRTWSRREKLLNLGFGLFFHVCVVLIFVVAFILKYIVEPIIGR